MKYIKPQNTVVRIQSKCLICTSTVSNVRGNVDLEYGGGGSEAARTREYNAWGEDW